MCFEIERKWVGKMDESLIEILKKEAKEVLSLEQGYLPPYFSVIPPFSPVLDLLSVGVQGAIRPLYADAI